MKEGKGTVLDRVNSLGFVSKDALDTFSEIAGDNDKKSTDAIVAASVDVSGYLFGKISSSSNSSNKTADDKNIPNNKKKTGKSRKSNIQKRKEIQKKQMRREAKKFVIRKMMAMEEEKEMSLGALTVGIFQGYVKGGVRSFAYFAGNAMKKLLILAVPVILLVIVTISLSLILLGCLGSKSAYDEYAAASTLSYTSYVPVSKEVEDYRDKIIREAAKYNKEEYVDLYLAVMMQESGGIGNDVFQCSESLGLPPGTLDVETSIKQGVKYLSAMMDKAEVSGIEDIDNIRLALQGYNMGGGYIDYALKADGCWTQENVIAYAKTKSGGVRNSDARAELLGPWRYGDSYYAAHVLRYYPYASTYVDGDGQEAVEIPLNKRMSWLFPEGTPKTSEGMRDYLETIDVPIIDEKGQKTTMKISVHKKLSANIKGAFEDMQKAQFKVISSATAGYSWRTMASNSNKISYHSYGCVVDLNWTHNGASYTSWPYNPGKDEYAVTDKIVKIWAEHGFYWGGNWSNSYFDPMHFTYVNH